MTTGPDALLGRVDFYRTQLHNADTLYLPGWTAHKVLIPKDPAGASEVDHLAIEQLKESGEIKKSRYIDSSPHAAYLVKL